jgi:uncharacterized membrane-anchored protein
MRNGILWGVLLVILAVVNTQIVGKELILNQGETMLLELAPRDPRSLLQGDYMALRYRMTDEVGRNLSNVASADGHAVVRRGEHGVASFVRLHDGSTPIGVGEELLYFRKRGESVRVASDAYFFQEGDGEFYRNARYGELRVDEGGSAVLVGLRNGVFEALGANEPTGAGGVN